MEKMPIFEFPEPTIEEVLEKRKEEMFTKEGGIGVETVEALKEEIESLDFERLESEDDEAYALRMAAVESYKEALDQLTKI